MHLGVSSDFSAQTVTVTTTSSSSIGSSEGSSSFSSSSSSGSSGSSFNSNSGDFNSNIGGNKESKDANLFGVLNGGSFEQVNKAEDKTKFTVINTPQI